MVGITVLVKVLQGGLIDGAVVVMGGIGGEKIAINSPIMIYAVFAPFFLFAMFVMALFIGQMFSKDFETKFYNVLFTKPITKAQYILGRFMGNMILMLSIFILMAIFHELTMYIPGMQKDLILKSKLTWYLYPILLNTIPNLYFVGALFIAGVIATKKTGSVFGVAFLLFLLQQISNYFSYKLGNEALEALLDPFGIHVLFLATKGWAAAEMNIMQVPLTYLMVLNRLLWIGIGTVLMFFAWKKFNFEFTLLQFKSSFLLNMSFIFKSPALYWSMLLGLIFMIVAVENSDMVYGTKVLPVTYNVADALLGGFLIFMLIIITFFTGELIWKARENKFDQIEDSTPVSTLHGFLSKFLTMFTLIVSILVFQMILGIVSQAVKGYFNFELGVYLQIFFIEYLQEFVLLLMLAFFIHNVVNHKYAAHFVFILIFVGRNFLPYLKIEHPLLRLFAAPGISYSDMSGYASNLPSYFIFSLYWFLVMLLATGVTVLTWKTGLQQNYWKNYLNKLKTKPVMIYNCTLVALTLIVAGYIFYNTNILNTFMTSKQTEMIMVNYEKKYSHFKKANQPKIQDIKIIADIYPEQRRLDATGKYILKNVGSTPIDTLLIGYSKSFEIITKDFIGKHNLTLVEHDEDSNMLMYKFNESFEPGDSIEFHFTLVNEPSGFNGRGATGSILKNGTFIDSMLFPYIGYNSNIELTTERRRKKYGLPEQDLMPETTDPWGLSRSYISRDADWISYELTVSTSSDQIALAPGELVAEWTEQGRNYYTYKIDNNVLNFYAFLSARYEVFRDKFNDIDLEIYYHKDHTYNLDNMMRGLKEALEYYTNAFGPYPHSILRIAEFPRYHAYAQAFPTLIPFSEGIGFIANLKKDTIDYPFYITAHEAAHQWWGHQVVGGMTRGSIMLTESFTEYSSLMVVKKNYSDELYRQQLRYAQLDYLTGRTGESRYELPLAQVERQAYLYYHKGMITMNAASRLLGEDVLNSALREFADQTRYTANPYTHTAEFMQVLDASVPDSLKVIIDDMFNKIVLYDHKIDNVNTIALDDERFQTTLDFTTEKRYYDEKGVPEIVEYSGWLEIGLLNKDKEVIQLEKVYINQKTNKLEIVSTEKPAEILLDPYLLTIDQIPYNNYESIK